MRTIIAILLTGFYFASLDVQAAAVVEEIAAVRYRAPFHLDLMAGGGDGSDGRPRHDRRILPAVLPDIDFPRHLPLNGFLQDGADRIQPRAIEAVLEAPLNLDRILGDAAFIRAEIRPLNFAFPPIDLIPLQIVPADDHPLPEIAPPSSNPDTARGG